MKHRQLGPFVPFLCGALLWSQFAGGAVSNYHLGFARMGAGEKAGDPVIENIILRSIENLGVGNVKLSSLSGEVSKDLLAQDDQRKKLRDAMEALAQYLRHPDLTSKEVGRARLVAVENARHAIMGILEWGPLIQEALILEMAAHWRTPGKYRDSKFLEAVQSALQIFPTIQLTSIEKYDLDTAEFSQVAFEEAVRAAAGKHRAICSVSLPTADRAENIELNGFEWTRGKTASLYPGMRAKFTGVLEGKKVESREILCERQQYFTFTWTPAKKNPQELASLAALGKKSDLESLILWDTQSPRLKLFLFTPGVGFDEIPMTKEARISDLSNYRDSAAPVATDAFHALLAKHQPESGSLTTSVDQSSWYNDWKVWAGVAVVSAAVITALILTSKPNGVESRPAGLTVRFP